MTGSDHPTPQLFIGGEWRDGAAGTAGETRNPANDDVLAAIPRTGGGDLDDALAAAQSSFRGWSRTPAVQRSAVLVRAAALLRERAESIAASITREQGKTLAESTLEVHLAAETSEWFAGEAIRANGRTIPSRAPGSRQIVFT